MSRVDKGIVGAATRKPIVPIGFRLRSVARRVRRHWQLYALLSLPLLWLIIFAYGPMYGLQIAFRDFNVTGGITDSPFVGLKQFERYISSFDFWQTLGNTVYLSIYSLLAGFPFPILLALGLHYTARRWFKNTVQMVTYAPYFISVVVVAGMLLQFLAPNTGPVNQILQALGLAPVNFMAKPEWFGHIYVWSGVWQTIGFGAVLYLAALTGVDPALHEAAIVDGASKLQRVRYIDLPALVPLAVVLLILSVGTALSTGFEKVLLLQNPLNIRASEVIDTYVYRVGLASTVPNYSYAAAIGLFKSAVGLILVVVVQRFAKRAGQEGAF